MSHILTVLITLCCIPLTMVNNIKQEQQVNNLYNNISGLSRDNANNIAKNAIIEHQYTKEEVNALHRRALTTNSDRDWYAYNYAKATLE